MGDNQRNRGGYQIPDVGNIDINKLTPVYGSKQTTGPEYISSGHKRGRDLFGQLTFNTGVTWLGGYVAGGCYGFVEGWRTAAMPTFKLRMNSVLNAVAKRGGALGNALGVVVGAHTTLVWVADQLDLETVTRTEASTPVFAGLLTGVIYKSTSGIRGAALSGLFGIVASCAHWYGTPVIFGSFQNKGAGKF